MHLDIAKQRGYKRNRANPSSVLNIQTSIDMANTPREDLKDNAMLMTTHLKKRMPAKTASTR